MPFSEGSAVARKTMLSLKKGVKQPSVVYPFAHILKERKWFREGRGGHEEDLPNPPTTSIASLVAATPG